MRQQNVFSGVTDAHEVLIRHWQSRRDGEGRVSRDNIDPGALRSALACISIVEVDETLIGGKRSGKRGRGAEGKTLVLVAVEERKKGGIGRIRLCVIPDASGDSLIPAIKAMVAPGSTIRTDGWKGYNRLKKEKGYKHIVVEHEEDNPGEDPTPLVHRIASLLKRWLLGTHQGAVHASHLPYYLDEYTFRFNRRYFKSRGKLFYRLLEQCTQIPTVTGVSLKNSS